MFQKMYNGILETKNHLQNPVSEWKKCSERFDNVLLLYSHSKQHVEIVNTVEVAPVERHCRCSWERCDKHFAKVKLLHNHLREHTGYANDVLMEVLLKYQAE
jgi:hypothetical protein